MKQKIQHLLIISPNLQDDDNRLIATYWFHEAGGMDRLKKMSAYEFLQMFADGKLHSPETIRRTRQKLQEENPNLRGKSYKARQEKAKEVANQMRKF